MIESEQDMTEAIKDVTSNWTDSLDAGAGWKAADGPISNYIAKGDTGYPGWGERARFRKTAKTETESGANGARTRICVLGLT